MDFFSSDATGCLDALLELVGKILLIIFVNILLWAILLALGFLINTLFGL